MINEIITLKNDSYLVTDNLATGGQGSIWKVRRQSDQSDWVMKTVKTTEQGRFGHQNPVTTNVVNSYKKRLQQEIDFLQSLGDPNRYFIVPCIDSGAIEDSTYGNLPACILPHYLENLSRKTPPFPTGSTAIPELSVCLKWIRQVATALQATHGYKTNGETFVHRDIKPENIMLTHEGDVRLIDFGIIKQTQLAEETRTHSYSETTVAPEQILASSYNPTPHYSIGAHSDMYALGCVIFNLFTGAIPRAQDQLKDEVILKDHSVSIERGGTGYLGKIGGLDEEEYKLFIETVEERQASKQTHPPEGDTLISVDDTDALAESNNNLLKNHQHLAQSFADLTQALLHADFQQRPTANTVIQQIEGLENALNPLRNSIEVDNVAVKNTAQINPDQPSRMPSKPVSPRTIAPSKPIKKQPDQSKQQKTSSKKASFGWLRPLFTSLVLMVLASSVYLSAGRWLPMFQGLFQDTQQAAIQQWQTDLNSQENTKQLHAWRNLKRKSTIEESAQAQAILEKFEQETIQRFQSDDPDKQRQAISGLTLMANNGTKSAMTYLGTAYQQGKAVKKDWGKAWDWYKKSGQTSVTKKNELERIADRLLHNKISTTEEKALAYQVAERAAKYEPAGDYAQKWMEYRYRVGDGVPKDKKKADVWKQRYEGTDQSNKKVGVTK